MKNSPEKPAKKKSNSIKILFSENEEPISTPQIVWPGEKLKDKIREFKKFEKTGGVRIIDVPYGDDEHMENAVHAMKAMDKAMENSLGDIISLIVEAVQNVYTTTPEHEEYVAKKDELMRSKLESLGLPENTTWEDYFLAAMGDAPYHVAVYARLRGLSNKEIEMLYKIFDRPVLGDNIRLKSVIPVIKKMIGMDK